MRKLVVLVVTLLFSSVCFGQLTKESKLIRDKASDYFEAIGLLVDKDYKDSSIKTMMINKQCKSLMKYLRKDFTKAQLTKLVPYMEKYTTTIEGVECTNWVMFMMIMPKVIDIKI